MFKKKRSNNKTFKFIFLNFNFYNVKLFYFLSKHLSFNIKREKKNKAKIRRFVKKFPANIIFPFLKQFQQLLCHKNKQNCQ